VAASSVQWHCCWCDPGFGRFLIMAATREQFRLSFSPELQRLSFSWDSSSYWLHSSSRSGRKRTGRTNDGCLTRILRNSWRRVLPRICGWRSAMVFGKLLCMDGRNRLQVAVQLGLGILHLVWFPSLRNRNDGGVLFDCLVSGRSSSLLVYSSVSPLLSLLRYLAQPRDVVGEIASELPSLISCFYDIQFFAELFMARVYNRIALTSQRLFRQLPVWRQR